MAVMGLATPWYYVKYEASGFRDRTTIRFHAGCFRLFMERDKKDL